MTVIRLSNGGLWVHNPTELNMQVLAQVKQLGMVHHIISPTQFSGDVLAEWRRHFPEADVRELSNNVDDYVKDPYLNRKSFVWKILSVMRRRKREILGPFYPKDTNEFKDPLEQDFEDIQDVQGRDISMDKLTGDTMEKVMSSEAGILNLDGTLKHTQEQDAADLETKLLNDDGSLKETSIINVQNELMEPEKAKPSDGRLSRVDDADDKLHHKKVQALRDQIEESLGARSLNQAEGISYLSSPNFAEYDYDPERLLTAGVSSPTVFAQQEDGLMHTDDIDEMIFEAGEFREHIFLHRPSRSVIVTNLVESHDLDDHTLMELHCLMQIGMAAPHFACPRGYSKHFTDLGKARESCIKFLMWDWDSIFMAHGVHRLSNGKQYMRQAMYWLLNPVQLETLKHKVFPVKKLESEIAEETREMLKKKRRRGFTDVSEFGV